MTAFVAFAWLAVNLATILLFWRDRQRAIGGGPRVAEADLFGLAVFGGAPAALLARQLFHDESRKQPFSNHLHIIFGAQIGALISLTFF